MALRSFLVVLGLTILAQMAYAQQYQDISALRSQVNEHVSQKYISQYGKEIFKNDIEISVSRVDPRLKLSNCAENIELTLIQPKYSNNNMTVKARCSKGKQWTIYVPVTANIFESVIVASRNIERGIPLSDADFTTQRVDVSEMRMGYIKSIDRLAGKELKRPLNIGDPIRLSNLLDSNVIRRGDSVLVEAKLTSLIVTAPGIALSAGYVGQQIKVRNTKSDRVVDALVSGPGKVTVSMN